MSLSRRSLSLSHHKPTTLITTSLIKKMLPAGNEMVEKTYQAKKNDKDLTACQTCGTSRWKVDNKTKKVYENIPAKNSQACVTIDEKFPEIAEDTRNLRLGISADGVDVNTGNRHHKKNVVESIGGTLLHVPGKTKDRLNARLDLAELYPYGKEVEKVIKGHVRNRNKPEGCIAEETIVEETIEFFSEYRKSIETIGIPPSKHETYENEEGKPLRHKQVLKTENPGKRIAFLENEHIKSFAKWLREEVERELAVDKKVVSENNSGVSVEEIDLHISKDSIPFGKIPLFIVIWVNQNLGGVKRDKLGYTLVDLNNLGHKVDPFVLASQALQVFYVKDPVDKKLSIVFKTPPKNYKDTYDEVDEEFSTVIHHRNDNVLPLVDRRDLANESRDDYYRKDCGRVL
ncbi:putative transposon, En/Spm-like protein [Tanacetum coccineum]